MKILKIGGSLITEKGRGAFEIEREDVMREIAKNVSSTTSDLIIVHGVGSFGHPHVKRYGIGNANGVVKVHNACLKLNIKFCKILEEYGINPIPFHPLETFPLNFNILKKFVMKGFTPVLHGDVILEGDKFRVLSGDEIVRLLAENLNPDRVGFASDSAVIMKGKIVEEINDENIEEVMRNLGTAKGKEDITGGMLKKVNEALKIAEITNVFIFDGLKHLSDFLLNKNIATRIRRIKKYDKKISNK